MRNHLERQAGNRLVNASSTSSNVVDLSLFRIVRGPASIPVVYYVSDSNTCSLKTAAFLCRILSGWNVVPIKDRKKLLFYESMRFPDLYLIDDRSGWADPLILTSRIHAQLPTHIVWIASEKGGNGTSRIRSAYGAGVSDVLKRPFIADEVRETLGLLIRLRKGL
jgi:hypothetical protein